MNKGKDDLITLHKNLLQLYNILNKTKKKEWDRILPFSELLIERPNKTKFVKAKSGSSVYDSSYIFGDVSIGKNTWIGPNTILDGSGGKLVIGDNCSVSSGVQIYTHDTVNWSLTGGKSKKKTAEVKIGNNCYVGPLSIITSGQKIGRCSVVGALSFVNSIIPPNSIAYGTPAKVVGKVRIDGKNVKFVYDNDYQN